MPLALLYPVAAAHTHVYALATETTNSSVPTDSFVHN